jgi:hypothetical protein
VDQRTHPRSTHPIRVRGCLIPLDTFRRPQTAPGIHGGHSPSRGWPDPASPGLQRTGAALRSETRKSPSGHVYDGPRGRKTTASQQRGQPGPTTACARSYQPRYTSAGTEERCRPGATTPSTARNPEIPRRQIAGEHLERGQWGGRCRGPATKAPGGTWRGPGGWRPVGYRYP